MMRKKFDNKLKELNDSLIEMANMIQITIKEAMDIFFEGDIDKAKQIIQNDQEINNYQKKIEQICYSLLIEQQPVASDLRLITAALKMVTDLERIGDQASDICELVIDMKDEKNKEKIETLLKERLKKDRTKTQVEGFTKLDLMEMTRKHICSHKE